MRVLSEEEKEDAYQDGRREGRKEIMILFEECARKSFLAEDQIRATCEFFIAKLDEYDRQDDVEVTKDGAS